MTDYFDLLDSAVQDVDSICGGDQNETNSILIATARSRGVNLSKEALAAARKNKAPVYFKSNFMGRKIVYGNTGISTNHVVGSKDEDLYFKVRIVGKWLDPEHVTLFYDNPRDYCVHYLMSLAKDARARRKRETPEMFENRVEQMLSEMDPIIRVWEEKRNRALYDAMVEKNRKQEKERMVTMVR